MLKFLKKFLKKLFTDRYFIFLIGYALGIAIGYYHATKIVNSENNEKYESGYLDAWNDFYKGTPKYNFVKNDDGKVVLKEADK